MSVNYYDIDDVLTFINYGYIGILNELPNELKNDKNYFYRLVEKNGNTCFFASKELKNDKDFIINAISINVNILKYTNPVWLNNIDVLRALKEKESKMFIFPLSYKWFEEKMKFLEKLEEEEYLNSIMPVNKEPSKLNKF